MTINIYKVVLCSIVSYHTVDDYGHFGDLRSNYYGTHSASYCFLS